MEKEKRKGLTTDGLALKREGERQSSLILQHGDDGLIASGGLPEGDFDIGVKGEIDIHATAELNEAHVVVDIALLTFGGIRDDATRNGSCHLPHKDIVARGGLDDNRRTLILRGSLGKPCTHEVAIMMTHLTHDSLHGKPVGMDIGDAHEDADHQTTVVEIFVLLHFLDDDDMAIGRGNNNIVRHLSLVNADGATEKIDNNGVNYGKDNYNGPKCNRATLIEKPTAQSDDAGIDGKAQQECRDSFVVYSVLLDFLQSSQGNMFLWQVQ